MDYMKEFRVKPGQKIKLAKFDANNTGGIKDRDKAEKLFDADLTRMQHLQYLLYAENKRALLVVLQAMDAGGKDGTIRHVMTSLNPQSCRVTSFKVPSEEELSHDFLWRIHKAVPRRGEVGVFNRSHYEDVLVIRVHKLVPKEVWSTRFEQINQFEKSLTEGGVHVIKFFLHIDADEQLERLKARLDEPHKQWKVTPADFAERQHWSEYQAAYADAISKCSTEYAPWYIIPSNHKWFRNLAVSRIIADTLESLDMKFPKPQFDLAKLKLMSGGREGTR